jgi:Ni/Fe-hydrogenase subunit HybB-like protein
LVGIALAVALVRFVVGLQGVTNLDNSHPWGLWIALDVATGVALAAGGFTSAALIHVLHRNEYAALGRPALLTAMLGYTFVAIGLLVDLGRPYNVWHVVLPWMGNPRSVLFEVGICVLAYLTVLYVEFAPTVCDRLAASTRWPRLAGAARRLGRLLEAGMTVFILAGVVLSCAHQSSLGSLLLIAPSKVHPLWWTPALPLLFLLSAVAVGLPMVILESLLAARALRLTPETEILARVARYVPVLLGIYASAKIIDLLVRDAAALLLSGSVESLAFAGELALGVLVPMAILSSARLRRSAAALGSASLLIVLGVAANRFNVFILAFKPQTTSSAYVPAIGEIALTVGLIAALVVLYRLLVTWLPVIAQPVCPGVKHVGEADNDSALLEPQPLVGRRSPDERRRAS